MYIYNVTVNINEPVYNEWLQWMQTKHIPNMMATKKFTAAKLTRVLVDEEKGGITYSVQYTTPNRATLESYYREDAASLRKEANTIFKGKFVTFRTELEVISEH